MIQVKYRTLIFYKNYFYDFFKRQNRKVREKIIWTFRIIETIEQIPSEYLSHMADTDSLYEIRIKQGSNIYRIFCFFEKEKEIVLINGFQKKSQKTPKSEINKALKIKNEYNYEEEYKNT